MLEDRTGNLGNLDRRLAFAVNDLGKPLPQRPVPVHLCKIEIVNAQRLELLEGRRNGFPALANVREELGEFDWVHGGAGGQSSRAVPSPIHRRAEGVVHQERNGHRADAARHGREEGGRLFH